MYVSVGDVYCVMGITHGEVARGRQRHGGEYTRETEGECWGRTVHTRVCEGV